MVPQAVNDLVDALRFSAQQHVSGTLEFTDADARAILDWIYNVAGDNQPKPSRGAALVLLLWSAAFVGLLLYVMWPLLMRVLR